MTDQELQLALAKMLPEQIEVREGADLGDFFWKLGPIKELDIEACLECIKDTEWLHVCWLVEQSLHSDVKCDYIDELEQSLRRRENEYFGDKLEKKFKFNHFGRFAVANASWQLRAQALCKVKGVQ